MEILEACGGQPLVIGAGLAGMMTALYLAPEPVVIVAKAPLGQGVASAWAQGGVAAAIGADDDPELHVADTLTAGDGLCDPDVVERVIKAAPETVADLTRLGVIFDRSDDGTFALGREAAHSRRRILHATGDATGRELSRALIAAVRRTPSITVLEGFEIRRLVLRDNRIAGALAVGPGGPLCLLSARVLLATGGVGGLYRRTSNPLGALGHGLALAARAGAVLVDLEFVQFHPTALDVGCDPMPLVSEAVRGEGAVLIDEAGARFMAGIPEAELAPRDIVARAVARHLAAGHRVFLDARAALGARFAARFPSIAATCHAAGIDAAITPIPVRPVAHYHMGGIATDAMGRTSVPGLWAAGEVAATGLHGANRLASNSLLEAAVVARWAADSIAAAAAEDMRPAWHGVVPPPAEPGRVRQVMSTGVGVVRERAGLIAAIEALRPAAFGAEAQSDAALTGLLIAAAALAREESRGAHFRSDFPNHAPGDATRRTLCLDEARSLVERILPETATITSGA